MAYGVVLWSVRKMKMLVDQTGHRREEKVMKLVSRSTLHVPRPRTQASKPIMCARPVGCCYAITVVDLSVPVLVFLRAHRADQFQQKKQVRESHLAY